MKHKKLLLLATLCSMGVAGTSLAAQNGAQSRELAHEHTHEHGVAAESLQLNAGKKWETDSALRQSMGNIRQAIASALHDIHENRLSKRGYAALSKKVKDEVGSMVANCKLEPKVDQQLHFIIADLLEGAEQMAGKRAAGKRQGGAVRVVGALEKYGSYFDDAGFVPLEH